MWEWDQEMSQAALRLTIYMTMVVKQQKWSPPPHTNTLFLSLNNFLRRTYWNLCRYSLQWAVNSRTAVTGSLIQWAEVMNESVQSINESFSLICGSFTQSNWITETGSKEWFVQMIHFLNSTCWIKDPVVMVLELTAHWRGRWQGK